MFYEILTLMFMHKYEYKYILKSVNYVHNILWLEALQICFSQINFELKAVGFEILSKSIFFRFGNETIWATHASKKTSKK